MVTRYSQNGWTVLEKRPPYVPIPGTDIEIAVRPGDVAFLLTRVASWFNRNIESLSKKNAENAPDEWGWALRPIRGQTKGYSNHASATAIDLNAVDHPRGVKGTFSADEKRRIRAYLAEYRGVIRWGEDFSGTVDGMHFEVIGTVGKVADVAAELRLRDMPVESTREDEEMFGMFICNYDGTYYVVSAAGKRKVSQAAANELRTEAKVPYVGSSIGSATLNEFPTFVEDGTHGGSTHTLLRLADDTNGA